MESGDDPSDLPKLSPHVDGDTDLMIGFQYLKYYPVMFELSNGLSIYKLQFVGSDGSRGIVAGPHRIFSEIHKSLGNNYVSITAYVKEVTQIYKFGSLVSFDTIRHQRISARSCLMTREPFHVKVKVILRRT